MKGVITIFALPQELEDLALTLNMLKRNSVFLNKLVKYKVEITMCLSDTLTNWNDTKLPKDYIKDRTTELVEKYLDWCEWNLVWDNESILGCVSQRRHSLQNNPDVDFFIWLDCDFIFKDITLEYMTESFKNIKEAGFDKFILTPQFVKQWDDSWNIIVNEKYLNYPLYYHEKADVYLEGLTSSGDLELVGIDDFKFAGGWFTLISKDLLQAIGIPDSLGHYGLEDSFIIECSKILASKGEKVMQFMLKNLIIGESYIHRPNSVIKKYISNLNKKEEFTKIAHLNFPIELKKFYERSNSNTYIV